MKGRHRMTEVDWLEDFICEARMLVEDMDGRRMSTDSELETVLDEFGVYLKEKERVCTR